jgi:hypothetical protein
MTNNLHQSERENLRHPASSYKCRGELHYVASPVSSYGKSTVIQLLSLTVFRFADQVKKVVKRAGAGE